MEQNKKDFSKNFKGEYEKYRDLLKSEENIEFYKESGRFVSQEDIEKTRHRMKSLKEKLPSKHWKEETNIPQNINRPYENISWYNDYINARWDDFKLTIKEKEEIIEDEFILFWNNKANKITDSMIKTYRMRKIRELEFWEKELTLRNLGLGKESWYAFKPYINNKLISWKDKIIYENDMKNVTDICFEKAWSATIQNISWYNWYFRCRFFYGVYDENKGIWWVRFHWLSIDEFYIEINMQKKWFLDCSLWEVKWVFTDLDNRIKWNELRELDFKYKTEKIHYTWELYKILLRLWATDKLIKLIIDNPLSSWRWNSDYRKLFFSQLKFLKESIIDEDKERLRNYPTQNVKRKYFEKYGYLPEEKYVETYNGLVWYFWIENRVLFYTNDLKFTKDVTELTNLEKRKELVYLKFKELFPNEKIDG